MSNHRRFQTAAVLLAAALVAGASPPDAAPPEVNEFAIRDGGPYRGDPAAPVTLIEYSDFTCGYCVKFFRETWPQLEKRYVATGKVRFVYRDYPRRRGGPGLDAAVAARCAGEQHQYWGMHDFLFGRGGHVSQADVEQQAARLRLNVGAYTRCLGEPRHAEAAYGDRAEATSLGFVGTPGFVLMLSDRPEREPAVMIPGAVGFDVFQRHIERLLKVGAVR
jgi:protein-disulfide isomerase